MASGQVQYKALVLIALIAGATAEECKCKDGGYKISPWKMGVCGVAAVGTVAAAPFALTAAGFTSAGVAAGSLAAWFQASIGNVVAGSTFAALQSAGAAGIGLGTNVGIFSAVGGLCGFATAESCCTTPPNVTFNCANLTDCYYAVKTIAGCLKGLKYLPHGRFVVISKQVAKIVELADKVAGSDPDLEEKSFAALKDLLRWLPFEIKELMGIIFDCLNIYPKVKNCIEAISCCFGGDCKKGETSIGLMTQFANLLAKRADAVNTYLKLAETIVGDTTWFTAKNATDWWTGDVQPVLGDSSEGGQRITRGELAQVLSVPLPDGVTKQMVETLLMRLNNTYNSWNSGVENGTDVIDARKVASIVNVMENYAEEAYEDGYDSISDWYLDGYKKFQQSDELRGLLKL